MRGEREGMGKKRKRSRREEYGEKEAKRINKRDGKKRTGGE